MFGRLQSNIELTNTSCGSANGDCDMLLNVYIGSSVPFVYIFDWKLSEDVLVEASDIHGAGYHSGNFYTAKAEKKNIACPPVLVDVCFFLTLRHRRGEEVLFIVKATLKEAFPVMATSFGFHSSWKLNATQLIHRFIPSASHGTHVNIRYTVEKMLILLTSLFCIDSFKKKTPKKPTNNKKTEGRIDCVHTGPLAKRNTTP